MSHFVHQFTLSKHVKIVLYNVDWPRNKKKQKKEIYSETFVLRPPTGPQSRPTKRWSHDRWSFIRGTKI